MTVRLSKIILCMCLAAFAFMVTFGNIADYGSNFAFVQHVLSMDTTFPGNKLMYRAITNETLWNAAYWFIILGEALTSILFLIGVFHLWQSRHGSGRIRTSRDARTTASSSRRSMPSCQARIRLARPPRGAAPSYLVSSSLLGRAPGIGP